MSRKEQSTVQCSPTFKWSFADWDFGSQFAKDRRNPFMFDCYDSSLANMPKLLIFGLVGAHNSF